MLRLIYFDKLPVLLQKSPSSMNIIVKLLI